MLPTMREHGPQLRPDEVARSSAGVDLRLPELERQVVCAFESSLEEDVGQLPWDKTSLEDK